MHMYTLNPAMPRLRRDAALLVRSGWSMRRVAAHFGYHPSTIMRWCRKAPPDGRMTILTRSSRPKNSPRSLSKEIIAEIIRLRRKRNRCADIIHQELVNQGIVVSLSSVKRTIQRQGLVRPRSKWKKYHQSSPRPFVEAPGDLVQVDTIHCRTIDNVRFYVYTCIDVYSRWAYARVSTRATALKSIRFIQEAQKQASFRFITIQSDHGPEFSTWFTETIRRDHMAHRHSRVRKPNDNAHIERFNRSIQDECLTDTHPRTPENYQNAIREYLAYYNYERLHLGIDKITPHQRLQVLPRS